MVGSMSFSSGALISEIPCFAVQSIAAPFLGCQKNSSQIGRQTEVGSPTMVKTQVHSIDFARGIPTDYSITVSGSTVRWPHFFHNVLFYTGVYDTSIFSRTQVHQATVPMHSIQPANWFNIFPTSSGCFLCI